MRSVIRQMRRMYEDDGRHDRHFAIEEGRLRWSLANLQVAIDDVIRASQVLHDLLISKNVTKLR